MWKLLSFCRSSWAKRYILIWMNAVWNAVIFKNNMSLTKCANEEPAQVLHSCCPLLLIRGCLTLWEQISTYAVVYRYFCTASFSSSASNIEARQKLELLLPQGHRIYLWSCGDLMESCCILESLRSILQTKEPSCLFCLPLGLGVSHLQPLDLCMELVLMHNGWIIWKSALSCVWNMIVECVNFILASFTCGFEEAITAKL